MRRRHVVLRAAVSVGLLAGLAWWLDLGTVVSRLAQMRLGWVLLAVATATITTTVFTDADGRYVFPPLDRGRYQVWGQAVGYEAGRADVRVGASASRQDLALAAVDDFAMQLSGPEWMDALPEDTPARRRMKHIFHNACGGCHNINFVTPEHVVPQVLESLPIAIEKGLRLPIVYNTSAFDSMESLGAAPAPARRSGSAGSGSARPGRGERCCFAWCWRRRS